MTPPTGSHPSAAALRRHYADAPHGQIHYYDGGGDGVPLVLLHQSPAASSDWFPLLPFFARDGLRVIAIDTPGMGLSDPVPDAPEIADFADAVSVVLDHASVASAHLLGHHSGVQIAIEAAVRHPRRVRSAALYGVPVMSADERAQFWQHIVPPQRDGGLDRPVAGGTNLTDYFRRVERTFDARATQRLLLGSLLAGPLAWHGHNAALRHDMVPALLAATQPLLLISHPGELLEANTRAAARLRPDARTVFLDMDGRLAMDDRPAALAAVVTDFLRCVEAQSGRRA